MQFYISHLLLMVTRAALRVSGVLFWILVYVASLLAAISYVPDAMRLVARGPCRAFQWRPRKTAPSCLTSSQHGQHGYLRIKVRKPCATKEFFEELIPGRRAHYNKLEYIEGLLPENYGHINKPGTPRKLENTGMRFHYVASGEKVNPLMLLLHGFPENWYSWRYQLDEFSHGYRVVAVDLRGFGGSAAPPDLLDYKMETLLQDVKDLITALGYTSCVLVGHDWGGTLAWTFAVRHRHMVSRLIVMNAPHPSAFHDYVLSHPSQLFSSRYVFLFQLPFLPEILLSLADFEQIRKPLVDATTGIQNKQRRLTKEEMEAYLYYPSQKGGLTPPLNYYRNLFGFFPVKAQDVLVPTLLLWGELDMFLEAAMVPEMQQYVHAPFQAEIIPNASHWLQQDQPEEVNRVIRDFLSQEMPHSAH